MAETNQSELGEDWAGESFILAAMFVVLTLGLMAATAACLVVVGLGLALWLPAVIATAADGLSPPPARIAILFAALAWPLAVAALLELSWRSFAAARTARCADFMLASLGASLALYAFLVGVPWSWAGG